MNLIKLIFIILFLQSLSGQAIPTPKMIKPVVVLQNVDESALVTFIAFEEEEGSYKTARGYQITKDNNLIARPEIFSWSLDKFGASFFSGAHYADITGEGVPDLVMLITNPQVGTYIRSWTFGPGYSTKKPIHEPYYIKSKQKASEAISSNIDILYQDKDHEIAICFGSPERKAVIIDYIGELNSKVIGKEFLENNVGPIKLLTKDLNNDGKADIYLLSNGAIKEEKTYYAPNFKETKESTININEKIRDLYFYTTPRGSTNKVLLLKNDQIYIEEWEKYFPIEATQGYKILGQRNERLLLITKQGNIVEYKINQEEKELIKRKEIASKFQKKDFNKIEYLLVDQNNILISHNQSPEILLQKFNEEQEQEILGDEATATAEATQKEGGLKEPQTNKQEEQKDVLVEEITATAEAAQQAEDLKELQTNKREEKIRINISKKQEVQTINKNLEKIIEQPLLMINAGEKNEITVVLSEGERFVGLEKIESPNKMILDKTKLSFVWTPGEEDAGKTILKYKLTYNTSEEYEVYYEKGVEKLKLKEELETTQYFQPIYVNVQPQIKISPSQRYSISANKELVVPIYINDKNIDQTLSLNMIPPALENAKIEDRKFFWTPTKKNYGENNIIFEVNDGYLQSQAFIDVFVDTVKTEINFDQTLIITVNKELEHRLPHKQGAEFNILESPENVRISREGVLHWIPTAPQIGNNNIVIEIKEKEKTYLYQMQTFVNAPPIISYRPDDIEYIRIGEAFEFTMRSFEQNEDQKHYWSIKKKPKNMTFNEAQIYWKADEADYVKYHIQLSDSIDVDDFYGTIYVNDIPKIISVPKSYVELGETFLYSIAVKDINKQNPYDQSLKNEIQYFLKTSPKNMNIEDNIIKWIPTEIDVGQHLIELEIYDGIEKDEQAFTLFVNDVPSIISGNDIKIPVGEEMHHFVKAQDANDLSNLIFGISSSLDNMMMNSKTGEILWTPTEKDIGSHVIEVSVSDGFDLSKDKQKINIFVYKNPQFIDLFLPEAYAGVEYKHTMQAADMYKKNIPEIDVYVNLEETNFQEASFNASNNLLKIIPTYEELGTQYVTFSLKDNYNNQIKESFPIKVISSPCEITDTIYVDNSNLSEEVINKLQKIDKSTIYATTNEKINILGKKTTSPDTIFITKYDTTITNITDSIFVTIDSSKKIAKKEKELTRWQKRRAERKAKKQTKQNKQLAQEQANNRAASEEKTKEPLVITTQHKNINIVNKETVVVEQIILTDNKAAEQPQSQARDSLTIEKKKNVEQKVDLGHNILGIRTPKEDKLQQHLFGQQSITKTQKTKYNIPGFLNQEMYWSQE